MHYFLIVTVIVGLVALAGTRSAEARAAVKTALILPEVLPGLRVQPLGLFTAAPIREDISVPTAAGPESAYLYRPNGPGRFGAVILHLGVYPDPDDLTLHRLAAGLARTGVVAIIPKSPRLQAGDIDPQDVEALVATFQYLRDQDYVDGARIGFAGFCVGASLSALAAADPRIADQVAFVNFFGGYYDINDVIRAVGTRQSEYQESVSPWTPNPMTVKIIATALISTLDRAEDRSLLEQALLRGEAVTDLEQSLSGRGGAVYAMVSGVSTTGAVDAWLASLSPEMKARLAALSPSSVIDRLHTQLFIMHDRSDSFIPVAESRRLRDAAPGGSHIYTEFSIFQHMHPTGAGDTMTFLREAGLLYQHVHRLMSEVA